MISLQNGNQNVFNVWGGVGSNVAKWAKMMDNDDAHMSHAQFIKQTDHQRQQKWSVAGPRAKQTRYEHNQEPKEQDNAQATVPMRMQQPMHNEHLQHHLFDDCVSPIDVIANAGES